MPGELTVAGRLHLDPSSLILEGGKRGSEQRLELPYSEIVGLGRSDGRLGRLPTLRLEGNGFGTLLIAALAGAGLNNEILVQLQTALASVL